MVVVVPRGDTSVLSPVSPPSWRRAALAAEHETRVADTDEQAGAAPIERFADGAQLARPAVHERARAARPCSPTPSTVNVWSSEPAGLFMSGV